ncbi:MAG: hypothetical protein N2Z62_16690 [Rhodobacteraceae bacterium]|nr:hypothetical protein [Paracoccaceae bacterium]
MSTAYYAIFHAMCRNAADMIVGGAQADRSKPAWCQACRAVDHGFAKGQCKNGKITAFPGAIQDFAAQFVEAQEERHKADYDPACKFTRSEVQVLISKVEQAIRNVQKVPAKDRRAFAVFVTLKTR